MAGNEATFKCFCCSCRCTISAAMMIMVVVMARLRVLSRVFSTSGGFRLWLLRGNWAAPVAYGVSMSRRACLGSRLGEWPSVRIVECKGMSKVMEAELLGRTRIESLLSFSATCGPRWGCRRGACYYDDLRSRARGKMGSFLGRSSRAALLSNGGRGSLL